MTMATGVLQRSVLKWGGLYVPLTWPRRSNTACGFRERHARFAHSDAAVPLRPQDAAPHVWINDRMGVGALGLSSHGSSFAAIRGIA